jgi:muconate cycloisomerase
VDPGERGYQKIAKGKGCWPKVAIRHFKKIGARELATDLRHTRAIVEALGDRASIRVDVNQAWDATAAAKGCRELAAMGIDLLNSRSARRTTRRWFALASILKPRFWRMKRWRRITMVIAWRSRALAALCAENRQSGRPGQRLAWHVAQAAGIGLYGGTMLEGTVGTVASLHAWSTLPLQWGTEMFGPLLLKDDIVSVPLTLPTASCASDAGLGVEADEDKLHLCPQRRA